VFLFGYITGQTKKFAEATSASEIIINELRFSTLSSPHPFPSLYPFDYFPILRADFRRIFSQRSIILTKICEKKRDKKGIIV